LKTTCIIKHIEDKSLVWFEPANQYVVLEKQTGLVLEQLQKKIPLQAIVKDLREKLDISMDKAKAFVGDLQEFYSESTKELTKESNDDNLENFQPNKFEYIKYYEINDLVLKVEYASIVELELVHLKFTHLAKFFILFSLIF